MEEQVETEETPPESTETMEVDESTPAEATEESTEKTEETESKEGEGETESKEGDAEMAEDAKTVPFKRIFSTTQQQHKCNENFKQKACIFF